ncbi:MAG: DNA repair protein RadC [Bacillota bacterium]|nr:DNA repair protein RadC [Bacillota bacterium]
MNIRELPKDEKPREKLLREGSGSLSTTELLAVLISSGTRTSSALEIAGKLLTMDRRGIRYLAECSPEELERINGMGKARICTILAAVELGKRISAAPAEKRKLIRSSSDIADIFMEKMRYYKKEYFICLLINAKGEIIEETEVSIGDLCSSTTHPREVFVSAVKRSAGSVVFLHNHPSGDPTPSETDIVTTRRLMEAGNILGIPVLDHIIIGDGTYVSMKAERMI